jgi:hypothetical protein
MAEHSNFSVRLHWLGVALAFINLSVFALIQLQNPKFATGDFKMFYMAASDLRTGHPVYLDDDTGKRSVRAYTHPAYELWLFVPLTLFPYTTAGWIWVGTILASAIWGAHLLGGRYIEILAFSPFLFVLLEQQDSALVLLALIWCWSMLNQGRSIAAGIVLGLALFKFAIVLPIAVVLSIWRPKFLIGFCSSGLSAALLSTSTVGISQTSTYIRYLFAMGTPGAPVDVYHFNPGAEPTIRGLSNLIHCGMRGQIVLSAVLLVMLCVVVLSDCEATSKMSVAVIAGTLLAPHLGIYDQFILVLPFILLPATARLLFVPLYIPCISVMMLSGTGQSLTAVLPFLAVVYLALDKILHFRNPTTARHHEAYNRNL